MSIQNDEALINSWLHQRIHSRQNTAVQNEKAISLLRSLGKSLMCTSRRHLKQWARTSFVRIMVVPSIVATVSDQDKRSWSVCLCYWGLDCCSAANRKKHSKKADKQAAHTLRKGSATVFLEKAGRSLPDTIMPRSPRLP